MTRAAGASTAPSAVLPGLPTPAQRSARVAPAVAPALPACGAVLRRLHARGGDVSLAHLEAAARLLAEWSAGGGQAVQPALHAVGRGAAPLLLWVCVHDRDLKSWTALPMNNEAGPADPKKQLGRLVMALDWLVGHYEGAEGSSVLA